MNNLIALANIIIWFLVGVSVGKSLGLRRAIKKIDETINKYDEKNRVKESEAIDNGKN